MEISRVIIIIGLMYLSNQILFVIFNYIQSVINSEKIKIEKREKYFVLAFLIALIVGLLYFQKEDVILGLQAGLLISLFWGLLLLIIKIVFHIPKLFSKKSYRIELTDNIGFRIAKGNSHKQYYWRDIHWIQFEKEKFRLIIKDKKTLVIDLQTQNLYMLLKNIPLGYKDFDYSYINSFFSNLKTCKVCGAIAVNESECLSCGCMTWNSELEKEYASYDEYVKENQLDIFSTMDQNEKFSDFKINDINFEFDPDWSPLVTKKEVLEYSKMEYWENE